MNEKEIKMASLEYCISLLTNKRPDVEFTKEINTVKKIHDMRMIIDTEKEEEELSMEDFHKIILHFKKKGKDSYNFITKSGNSLKNTIFTICQKIWESENIPSQWEETTLIQLFKGKGSRENLDFYRFIHSKPWLPKLFEGIVVQKMKINLVNKMSKFQIAKAGHRPQEHLFVVKSIMALYILLKLPLIIQCFDIRKFFDSEVLRDGMNTIHKAGITGKLY